MDSIISWLDNTFSRGLWLILLGSIIFLTVVTWAVIDLEKAEQNSDSYYEVSQLCAYGDEVLRTYECYDYSVLSYGKRVRFTDRESGLKVELIGEGLLITEISLDK